MDRDQWTSDITAEDRKNYDSVLEQVLALLEPVCLQEQQFCVSFFQVQPILFLLLLKFDSTLL